MTSNNSADYGSCTYCLWRRSRPGMCGGISSDHKDHNKQVDEFLLRCHFSALQFFVRKLFPQIFDEGAFFIVRSY